MIDDDDVAAVVEVLRGDYLTTGPTVERLRGRLCARGRRRSCGALRQRHRGAAPGGAGARSSAGRRGHRAVAHFPCHRQLRPLVGAEVVFADVDPETGLMTPATLEAAIASAKKRESGPAGAPGRPALRYAGDRARRRDVRPAVVEDACTRWAQARVGRGRSRRHGDFSFHPVKTIATGEGGMVTTSDARSPSAYCGLRNHGMVRDPRSPPEQAFRRRDANPWYYEMAEPGLNYRLPDILGALARSQIAQARRLRRARRALVADYDRRLARSRRWSARSVARR